MPGAVILPGDFKLRDIGGIDLVEAGIVRVVQVTTIVLPLLVLDIALRRRFSRLLVGKAAGDRNCNCYHNRKSAKLAALPALTLIFLHDWLVFVGASIVVVSVLLRPLS